MRILVIEDDLKVSTYIYHGLQQAGFAVDQAHDGDYGLELGLSAEYDAIVLDLMLPGQSGLTLLEKLRRQHISTPVIILSANRSVDDRVKGLHAGSDDYLTKPFSFSELLARIQALIRRSNQTPSQQLSIADLELDISKHRVTRGGQEIELQPKEFTLLQYLLYNQEKVISKTMILEHVYDYNFDPQTNVVDVLVCRLRAKIDKAFDTQLIHTVRGIGYVLKVAT